MQYRQIPRNRPIASLIKLYIDKKSGQVSDARKEIQRRFDHLDWKDQKRIIHAFLQSGKSDRKWAYGKIFRQWDDSYLEPVKELWEKYHEDMCTWSVIQYFPIEYVRSNASELEEVNGYYHLCERLAGEDSNYRIDRSKLRDVEYLIVMLHSHRKVSEDEAKDIFFGTLYKFCLMSPENVYGVHHQKRGFTFSIGDISYLNSLRFIISLLGLDDVSSYIERWNERVMLAMFESEEFYELEKEAISDEEYNEKRIAIWQKYIYKALDDKYKKPTDEQYINKLRKKVNGIGELSYWHKHGMPALEDDDFENGPDAHEVLDEMMEQNPSVANLVSSFKLVDQSEEEVEGELPF